MGFSYLEIKEYNDTYVDESGYDTFSSRGNDRLCQIYRPLWDYCVERNYDNIEILEDSGFPLSEDQKGKCYTITYCQIYEHVMALPEVTQITLTLMGLRL